MIICVCDKGIVDEEAIIIIISIIIYTIEQSIRKFTLKMEDFFFFMSEGISRSDQYYVFPLSIRERSLTQRRAKMNTRRISKH